MKTYIIRLLDYDNFGTAKEKLSWSRSNRTLIVWPEKKSIITKKFEISLLQRHSRSLGTTLAIVSRDEDVVGNANELGIPNFPSVREASRTNWDLKSGIIITTRRKKSTIELIRRLKERARYPRFKPLGNPLGRFLISSIGIFAFFIVGAMFLPTAEIVINLPKKVQEIKFSVWASPEISSPNLMGGIPARKIYQLITVDGSIPSTGSMVIPVEHARGKITLINISEKPVEVPQGTIVTTIGKSPEKYLIQENIFLPADQIEPIEANIFAVNPGTEGNVTSGEIKAIEGSIGLLVNVENHEPTTGGTKKQVISPTENDYIKLKEQLILELKEKTKSGLPSKIDRGEIYFEETIQVSDVTEEIYTPSNGQPGGTITLKLSAQMETWVVNEYELLQLVNMSLDAGIPEGSAAIKDSEVQINKTGFQFEEDKIRWTVKATRAIQPEIKSGSLSSNLIGLQPKEAAQMLKLIYSLDNEPKITIEPSIWPILPFLPFQIQITTL